MLSDNLQEQRKLICMGCPNPCKYQFLKINDSNFACEYYPAAEKTEDETGLGSMVETVAQPIATAIDNFANSLGYQTDLKNCQKCKDRKKKLNNITRIVKEYLSG